MAIVEVNGCLEFISDLTDVCQRCDQAIHGEDAVGCDQFVARPVGVGLTQLSPQVIHVAVAIAVASRFTQADAVDDACVVELVGYDSVLGAQQGFIESPVGIEG